MTVTSISFFTEPAVKVTVAVPGFAAYKSIRKKYEIPNILLTLYL